MEQKCNGYENPEISNHFIDCTNGAPVQRQTQPACGGSKGGGIPARARGGSPGEHEYELFGHSQPHHSAGVRFGTSGTARSHCPVRQRRRLCSDSRCSLVGSRNGFTGGRTKDGGTGWLPERLMVSTILRGSLSTYAYLFSPPFKPIGSL